MMTEGLNDDAETIKSKRTKKKGKKRRNSSVRGSVLVGQQQLNQNFADNSMVEDMNETLKSARTGRSVGNKKKKGSRASSVNKSQVLDAEDQEIQFNSRLGFSNLRAKSKLDVGVEDNYPQYELQDEMANTNISKRSAKKKKKNKNKKKGSRSSSRGSQRGSDEDFNNRPDFEAEVVVKRKNSNVSNITKKSDLLKPVSAVKSTRGKVQEDLSDSSKLQKPDDFN